MPKKNEDKELVYKLIELMDSKHGDALREYNRIADMQFLTSLGSLDPVTDATLIARTQGMRFGVYNLENYVISEKKRIADANAPAGEKKEEPDGNLYGTS